MQYPPLLHLMDSLNSRQQICNGIVSSKVAIGIEILLLGNDFSIHKIYYVFEPF